MNGKIFGWLRKPWMSKDYRMSIFDGDRVRDGVPQCKALMDCDPNVTDL
jgi:hypothetical protein